MSIKKKAEIQIKFSNLTIQMNTGNQVVMEISSFGTWEVTPNCLAARLLLAFFFFFGIVSLCVLFK